MKTLRFYTMSLVISCVIISFLSLLSSTTDAMPEYRYHICSNKTNFAPDSTYKSNLNSLYYSLSSTATTDGNFYHTSVGDSPSAAFLCRGDLLVEECQICLGTAIRDVMQGLCPDRKRAIIWYDQCTLRYEEEPFFGVMAERPKVYMYDIGNISDTQRFNQVIAATMNDLITTAVTDAHARMFATRESDFSELQTLYTLVQCTPDISSLLCNRCLREAAAVLPDCCSGAKGANILSPSCNIRYEVYPFYRIMASNQNPTPELSPHPSPPPPPPTPSRGNFKLSPAVIASICATVAVIILLIILGCYCLKRKQSGLRDDYNFVPDDQTAGSGNEMTTVESLQFDFGTIQMATNNFSDDKKLGEGGFGAVYKGRLSNGQEIAVKRLSKTSSQGVREFKNEVFLVARLQHRNLTRLLGFCMEGEEKLLIYEFVPNKSLDYFLFDQRDDQTPLDWATRYKIVGGIARGILYLHEDSRLRIIHRDLKASNILLDEQMNPKVSDFGLAKICGVQQTQGNTNRIVGTYGYMSPEYAFYGQFSVKSDVFSFGVLVIEIVTGQKGTRFLSSDSVTEDLLSFTWKHWSDGTTLELLDPRLGETYTLNEVIRCIHIGLLCVQENPANRPTMATVVLMLSSYSVPLPLPKQPSIFPNTRTLGSMPRMDLESEISLSKAYTINEMSITDMNPR